jgi:predicted N-acyltransferase
MIATAPAALPRVTPLDAAAAVPAGEWNRLARRGFHLHRWHVVAEQCGWRPRHVGVGGADGLSAIVPAYLMDLDTYGNLHDRWLGPLARPAARLGCRLGSTIAVTAPFGCVSDPLGEFASLSEPALDGIFDLLEARARDDGARAVLWPHVGEGNERLIDCALRRGYAAMYAGASARLDVPWSALDDYVASRSKSVRRTVRAELRAFEGGDLRTEAVEDFRAFAPRIEALHRATFRARNGRPMPLAPEFFARLAAEPTPGLWAQLTWRADQLVGASMNLAAGGVMDGTFSAVADGHQGTPVYYGDLIYEPVRIACALRLGAIDLGPTALVPKVLRGARLYRRVALVRGMTPGVHRALTALGCVVAAWTARKECRRLGAAGGPHVRGEAG